MVDVEAHIVLIEKLYESIKTARKALSFFKTKYLAQCVASTKVPPFSDYELPDVVTPTTLQECKDLNRLLSARLKALIDAGKWYKENVTGRPRIKITPKALSNDQLAVAEEISNQSRTEQPKHMFIPKVPSTSVIAEVNWDPIVPWKQGAGITNIECSEAQSGRFGGSMDMDIDDDNLSQDDINPSIAILQQPHLLEVTVPTNVIDAQSESDSLYREAEVMIAQYEKEASLRHAPMSPVESEDIPLDELIRRAEDLMKPAVKPINKPKPVPYNAVVNVQQQDVATTSQATASNSRSHLKRTTTTTNAPSKYNAVYDFDAVDEDLDFSPDQSEYEPADSNHSESDEDIDMADPDPTVPDLDLLDPPHPDITVPDPDQTVQANADVTSNIKCANDRLFTHEQEDQINKWIAEERDGRRKMKQGGVQRVHEKFVGRYGETVTMNQMSVWMRHANKRSKRKTNKPTHVPFTAEARDFIHELRNEFPDITWPQFTKLFHRKRPDSKHITCVQLQNVFNKYVPNQKRGHWSPAEEMLFMDQFDKFGWSVSRYEIPRRTTDSIRRKMDTFFQSALAKLKGKSFSAIIMDSLRFLTPDGSTVSRQALLEEIIRNNSNISSAFLTHFFKAKFTEMLRHGRIQQTDDGEFVVSTRPALVPLPRLKAKKQPPLRDRPLDDSELEHLNSQINMCQFMRQRTKFEWFNDEKHKFIVTTQYATRRLDLIPIKDSFADDDRRRNLAELLYDPDNDISDDDEDVDQPWFFDQQVQEENEEEDLLNLPQEKKDRGINAFGIIKFKHSKKGLLFFTHLKDILMHFRRQMLKLRRREGCPSWFEAIVENKLTIDWKRIEVMAVTEGATAAMRLKLMCVNLLDHGQLFNVRRETYMPILSNFHVFQRIIIDAQLTLDEDKIKEMSELP